jgi:hypothetical protein
MDRISRRQSEVQKRSAPILNSRRREACLALACALMLAGCTHKARVFHAPDAAPLAARQETAVRHVQAAKVHFAAATVSLRSAQQSHGKAVASQMEAARRVTLLEPAVGSLRFLAPAELRPEIESIQVQVQALSAEIEKTTGEMATTTRLLTATRAEQAAGTGALEKGNAEINEIQRTLAPEYFAEVEKLAASANAESLRAARAENQADHRGRIIGLACAIAAAVAATRLVRPAVPASWGWPAGAFAAAYALGRFLL